MRALKLHLLYIVPAITVTGFLSGCLSRSAAPSLPYIQPAQSVPVVDPTQIRMVSRVDEMEAELRRLRDYIERMEGSGGDPKSIKRLQERVSAIESRLGIDTSAQSAGFKTNREAEQPDKRRRDHRRRQRIGTDQGPLQPPVLVVYLHVKR